MVTVEEVASSSFDEKLQEVQRVCKSGGEAASATIVEVVKLARDNVETKRKNAMLFERNTNMEAKLVGARAGKDKMREQNARTERRITILKLSWVEPSWRSRS